MVTMVEGVRALVAKAMAAMARVTAEAVVVPEASPLAVPVDTMEGAPLEDVLVRVVVVLEVVVTVEARMAVVEMVAVVARAEVASEGAAPAVLKAVVRATVTVVEM